MKVISKVSDGGTQATVCCSYSFRHFCFVDSKQTRHQKRQKWEMGRELGEYCVPVTCRRVFIRLRNYRKILLCLFSVEFSLFQSFSIRKRDRAEQIVPFASWKWVLIEAGNLVRIGSSSASTAESVSCLRKLRPNSRQKELIKMQAFCRTYSGWVNTDLKGYWGCTVGWLCAINLLTKVSPLEFERMLAVCVAFIIRSRCVSSTRSQRW